MLDITHSLRAPEVNPKGIPSLSPGLRAASYPGYESSPYSPTLKGLKHPTRPTEACQEPATRYNPFRVEPPSARQPRVARGSQPWAGGYNPVGIEKRPPDSWGKISPKERAGLRAKRRLTWNGLRQIRRGSRIKPQEFRGSSFPPQEDRVEPSVGGSVKRPLRSLLFRFSLRSGRL